MLQGTLQIRRSVAVVAISGTSVFGCLKRCWLMVMGKARSVPISVASGGRRG